MAFELTEGQGALFINDRANENPKSPQFRGSFKIFGQEYWISAWEKMSKNGNQFLSLSVQRKDQQTASSPEGTVAPPPPPGQQSAFLNPSTPAPAAASDNAEFPFGANDPGAATGTPAAATPPPSPPPIQGATPPRPDQPQQPPLPWEN